MGIRPADMQMIVHKTQETHQAKQNVVSKQDNELLQAQIQTKEDTEKKSQMVNNLEQKTDHMVKNDKKEREENAKKKKKKKKEDETEEKDERAEINKFEKTGTKFDMKV